MSCYSGANSIERTFGINVSSAGKSIAPDYNLIFQSISSHTMHRKPTSLNTSSWHKGLRDRLTACLWYQGSHTFWHIHLIIVHPNIENHLFALMLFQTCIIFVPTDFSLYRGKKKHLLRSTEASKSYIIFGFTIPFKDNKKVDSYIQRYSLFKDFQPWKFPRFAITVGTLQYGDTGIWSRSANKSLVRFRSHFASFVSWRGLNI